MAKSRFVLLRHLGFSNDQVREANDYAVVLTDRKGRNLAQSTQSIPSFIATVPATIRVFIREHGIAAMRPGDIFITNDPWHATGHLNDATIAAPIFRGNEVIGFAGVVSHLPDIGGRLRNPANRELFEEGLQIPPMHLLAAGQEDRTLTRLIRQNVREPEETMAQISAFVEMIIAIVGMFGALALVDEDPPAIEDSPIPAAA